VSWRNDAIQLRRRHDALVEDLDKLLTNPVSGTDCRTARTVTVTTYPTTAKAAYGIQITDTVCAETEGAAPTITLQSGTEYALNLGGTIPPVGTDILIERSPNGYWVFSYG
jgi:hypothetical protein